MCVCVRACVCPCVCVHMCALRIVSMDKILRFTNTLISLIILLLLLLCSGAALFVTKAPAESQSVEHPLPEEENFLLLGSRSAPTSAREQ